MFEPLAIEKISTPVAFIKESSTDFKTKNLNFVKDGKNFMFQEFKLMTLKPENTVNVA